MKLNLVPARTGLTWVKSGLATFARQPLAMAGLFFMYMAAASVLASLPVVGLPLALAVVPAATLGLMAATQEAAAGKFPMPTLLVSAFRAGRQRLRAMLMLGVIYAVACVAVSLLANWLAPLPVVSGSTPPEQLATGLAFQQAMGVTLLLYLPVAVAFWHAPALVHWHGVTPVKSLFFSAVAVLRNIGAFAVYLVAWLLVFLGASSVVTLTARAIGGPSAVAVVMLPTAMLLASMFFCSIYFTFRDSFLTEAPDDATPTPPWPPQS